MSDAIETIDLRDQFLGRHAEALAALHRLAQRVPIERWALVGGMMTLIVGRRAGVIDRRSMTTKDADVLVDVITWPDVLARAVHELGVEQGMTLADPIDSLAPGRAARCTFNTWSVSIDILCPDGTPDEHLVVGQLRSLAIPGGRIALETARTVALHFSDDYPDVVLRVPSRQGALPAKAAAAIDPRTAQGQRHIQDVAFLLSLPGSPVELASAFTAPQRQLLEQLPERLEPASSPAWLFLDGADRQRALATLRFLLGT